MLTLDDVKTGLTPDPFINNPITEFFVKGDIFSEWRISYGLKVVDPFVCYLSIYPSFCRLPKATFHYVTIADLFIALDEFNKPLTLSFCDTVAAVFAISRNKESFELFSEQKLLMDLGLKHFCLDNYYQEQIKNICNEYFEKGTLAGSAFNINNIIKVF